MTDRFAAWLINLAEPRNMQLTAWLTGQATDLSTGGQLPKTAPRTGTASPERHLSSLESKLDEHCPSWTAGAAKQLASFRHLWKSSRSRAIQRRDSTKLVTKPKVILHVLLL